MNKEILVPLGIIGIVSSMLIPLPAAVMDLLLVSNLVFAVILLISAFYISDSLKLSALPTLLLLATLFRLSLNISTTRLILSAADPGQTVKAFGSLVIQGNLAVGIVVFLVITLVQFLVVAKGAERVAEVSARFTLDGLPGKQMSIDADVRSGLYDMETARRKRNELHTESRFYGALDGAMKFVKGDAIAGIIIVLINIIGGFCVGLLIEGLDLGVAVHKYTILTVGDGLLSQIPSLLNSLAAGFVVTRVSRGDGNTLSSELLSQLLQSNKVKGITAGFCGGLSLVSGMPKIPFLAASLLLGIGAIRAHMATKESVTESPSPFQPKTPPAFSIEIDSIAARFVLQDPGLAKRVEQFRQKIFSGTGLLVSRPEICISENHNGSVYVRLRGVLCARFELSAKEGCNDELFSEIERIFLERSEELLDDVMTRRLLDFIDSEAPELVSSVVPGIVSVTQFTEILRALCREEISVRSLITILQSISECGSKASDDRGILEEVRVSLKGAISEKYADSNGELRAVALEPLLDLAFARAEREKGSFDVNHVARIAEFFQGRESCGEVLLVSKAARRLIFEMLLVRGVSIPVIAFDEVAPDIQIKVIETIELKEEDDREEIFERLSAAA